MPDQIAHLTKLLLHVVQRARGVELDDAKTFLLEQFPRRALGKAAGDHDIRLQHQHILRLAGELRKPAGFRHVPRAGRIARIGTEPENLPGICQRHQQLIGAQIDRSKARQLCRIGGQPESDGGKCDRDHRQPPSKPLALWRG